ncbi:DUF3631 domain-containing protein [Streptomyces sp. NPDC048331]|uniref:DUF3631 domain-containing protein n=1 Tax=Streptomyces sp. NPDC048331 TaxID=3365534 RepID=UPI00371D0109
MNVFVEVQQFEQRLLTALTTPPPLDIGSAEEWDLCTDLLIARLAAGRELSLLLSAPCLSEADFAAAKAAGEAVKTSFGTGAGEQCCKEPDESAACLLDACSNVFAELGDPHAVASADLVEALQYLPGTAGNHWRYSDLTQARLAQLLAPHGTRTRDITLPDGRRRKSYTREALLAAMGVCTNC